MGAIRPFYANASLKIASSNPKLDFKDVLIVPNKTSIKSRKEVSLKREIHFPQLHKCWEGTPIIASNMDTVSNLDTFNILRQYDYITCFPKHFNIEWLNELDTPQELQYTNNYMLSCGVSKYDINIVSNLIDYLSLKEGIKVKFICVDVANGYMTSLTDACLRLRETFPDIIIVAGNVVTPERTYELIKHAGVNIVKIGIGSGSVCTTRLKAGVGYPQLSAVLECSEAAKNASGYIISDGGIIHPCDVSKAFGAGADFVMCGSIFAGHEESPGDTIEDPVTHIKYKRFYGMSSETANNKYSNGLQNYRSSEGKEVIIPLKGSLHTTIQDLNGSVRSTCTYTNSHTLEKLSNNTRFILVNNHHNTSL